MCRLTRIRYSPLHGENFSIKTYSPPDRATDNLVERILTRLQKLGWTIHYPMEKRDKILDHYRKVRDVYHSIKSNAPIYDYLVCVDGSGRCFARG